MPAHAPMTPTISSRTSTAATSAGFMSSTAGSTTTTRAPLTIWTRLSPRTAARSFATTSSTSVLRWAAARSGQIVLVRERITSLGLAPPYWAFAHYPDFPSIGKFEWKIFDPERWVPEYPNPAFLNRLPDDEFWGAKLVTAF